MIDQRKQAVSVRLGESDLRNIKRLAQRLGVRDSEILRYAVKAMLARMAPLCDEAVHGRHLLPVLVECGDDLIRHFELDTYRLESLINEGASADARVERDDVALLAMSGLREQYLVMRMKEGAVAAVDAAPRGRSLRHYLYEKYVYRLAEREPNCEAAAASAV